MPSVRISNYGRTPKGGLESTKEAKELLEAIAESNSSLLSALRTFHVHP